MDDYRQRALLHRPHYAAGIATAVLDLRSQGLLEQDIANALGINADVVRKLLSAPTQTNHAGTAGSSRRKES